jgi:hypothetical protein
MVRTTSFVVKTMKQELKVDNIFLQSFDALASSIFIELFDSSSGEALTPLFLLTELLKGITQFDAYRQSHPPMWGVFSLLSLVYM